MFSETEHEKLKELCSAYIDGQLSPSERVEFEAHLQICVECREELTSLQETVQLLHRIPMAEVPRSFTLSETPPIKSRSYFTFFKFASAVAAVLLVFTFSMDVFSQTMSLQFAGSAASKSANEASKSLQPLQSAPKDQTGNTGALSAPPAAGLAQPTPQVGVRGFAQPAPTVLQPGSSQIDQAEQNNLPVQQASPGAASSGKDEPPSSALPVVPSDSSPSPWQGSPFRPFEIGLATLLFLLLAGTLIARHAKREY